ncbi:MAG: hypothetical protein ACF8QF_08185, partial [Phycisphaerales bacterium]
MRSNAAISSDPVGRRERLGRLVAALDRLGEAQGVDALGHLGLGEAEGAPVAPDRLARGCVHEWLAPAWGADAPGRASERAPRARGPRGGGWAR